jgi:hypothetical protein
LDCRYPKLKRYYMSHLERYGWVERHPSGWTITPAGRQACHRYDAHYDAVLSSVGAGEGPEAQARPHLGATPGD